MVKNYNEILQNNLNVFKNVVEKSSNKELKVNYSSFTGRIFYALVNTITQAQYDLYRVQDFQFRQFFPQTADLEHLQEYHGNTLKIFPFDKTPATGYVIFQPNEGESAGGTIPQGTQLTFSGKSYSTNNTVVITTSIIKVKSIIQEGKKATCVLIQDFKMANGMKIDKIYGANQEIFNKENFTISAISTDSFTYELNSEGYETATGDIYIQITSATSFINSNEGGSEFNLVNGTQLKTSIPKIGVNENALVYYDGITGGRDKESVDSYRNRIILRYSGLPQGFNRANIEIHIRDFQFGKYSDALIFIPRSEDINGNQESGFTTIYMLKKDFSFLSNTEKEDLKYYLTEDLKNAIYPIQIVGDKFNILDPVFNNVEISVKLIGEYNTLDMQQAVKETIKEMQNDIDFSYFRKTIYNNDIKYWLNQVVDIQGNFLQNNYILNEPLNNIILNYNEFPKLKLILE